MSTASGCAVNNPLVRECLDLSGRIRILKNNDLKLLFERLQMLEELLDRRLCQRGFVVRERAELRMTDGIAIG